MKQPSEQRPQGRLAQFLPLKPTDLQVLLTLSEGPLHAYGISKAVEAQLPGQVDLEIGSLYRMMARLLDLGLIEESPDPQANADVGASRRRRCYRITSLGLAVARAEANRLLDVVRVAREKDLLPRAEEL